MVRRSPRGQHSAVKVVVAADQQSAHAPWPRVPVDS